MCLINKKDELYGFKQKLSAVSKFVIKEGSQRSVHICTDSRAEVTALQCMTANNLAEEGL